MKEKGLLDEEVANQLDRFLNENKPRYCKYKDTASILGNTYGVLILQDFKDITPNILSRTVETVSGGGTIRKNYGISLYLCQMPLVTCVLLITRY